MKSKVKRRLLNILILVGISAILAGTLLHRQRNDPDRYYAAFTGNKINAKLAITYPFDGTLFPPEICAPIIKWNDPDHSTRRWLISFAFGDGAERIDHFSDSSRWSPSDDQWQFIKQHSVSRKATVAIIGIKGGNAVSAGRFDVRTSTDSVGAPLFYREVILPFKEAVKDPSKIRWRFGSIAKRKLPPVVLDNLPVCGNCHSFSADGKTMGMDVDYANDKGSYAIVPVASRMTLDSSDIITWNDFKKADKVPTFGLLSQVSPDGKWVVSTVKDNSVFVPKPDLGFSQLFFPVKGILCAYNRATRTYSEIPGANDRKYVQSNPVWSPDGSVILFIRSEAYNKLNIKSNQVLLTEEQCADFLKDGKLFKYDIYQVPFNKGKGGTASPLAGASNNGMSNYFPRFSPDGKWLVFCQAKSYSLLQPDSKLYIMPSRGGEPRLMNCNRDIMNSWHSWSPNGKWLVFSSKAFTPYTQLFLTHIDENGMDTPPVLLDWLTSPDRAANIPEFVNAPDTAIRRIKEHFVNDVSYVRAAREYAAAYESGGAILALLQKALAINPENALAHYDVGTILAMQDKEDAAMIHFRKAIGLDSNFLMAYCNLATAFAYKGQDDSASRYYRMAIARKIVPNASSPENVRAIMSAHTALGSLYVNSRLYDQAASEYAAAQKLDPSSADLHCALGDIFMAQNNLTKAKIEYGRAAELKPDFERAVFNLGVIFHKLGQTDKALESWEKVLKINPNNKDAQRNIHIVTNGRQ